LQATATVAPSSASSVQVITPPFGNGSSPAISRTDDLSLEWKGGSGGTLLISLRGDAWGVSCLFPAAAGHGIIPSTKLAPLSVGQLYVRGVIGDIERFNAGDYQLSLVRWQNAGILGCGSDCRADLQP
jgi:hypothetical protein